MYIQANKISKNFSGTPLFENLTLQINENEKIGLVGQNGTGKTTLFQLLLGIEGIEEGVISRKKGVSIGWVPQQLTMSDRTAFEYISHSFVGLHELQAQLHHYEAKMMETTADLERILAYYGRLQQQFEEQGGYQLNDRIVTTLKGLGLAEQIQTPLHQLSGGERVRVELAKILIQENDVLLLDEPTNHLDLAGIQWLENYLKTTKSSFIVISHDRAFLDAVTKRIIEIEDGQLINYPGNYSRYIELKNARMVELSKNYELQQKEIQRIKRMIHRYRQWGNEGDNEAFFKKAKELERRLEKMILVKAPDVPKKRLRAIDQASRSGKEVIIAQQIGKIMGEKLLFTESDFAIYSGERVAIVGENGSGKTTLLRLIMNQEIVDEGQIKYGASLKLGYLPQQLTFPDTNQRILSYTKMFIGEEQKARQMLAQHGFFREDVTKRIGDLSGGEQVRLYLMRLLQQKINFLILDEPTNHLDIYVREEIEALLASFTGTILAVTHDRYFLKKNFETRLQIADEQIQKLPLDD